MLGVWFLARGSRLCGFWSATGAAPPRCLRRLIQSLSRGVLLIAERSQLGPSPSPNSIDTPPPYIPQVDINGLSLLEDCDLTLVGGRKYGLIGRNGVGKTTFLKFLAAHRFEGVPEHLQILHIEQEVRAQPCPTSVYSGGDLSVLDAVLQTDRERKVPLPQCIITHRSTLTPHPCVFTAPCYTHPIPPPYT